MEEWIKIGKKDRNTGEVGVDGGASDGNHNILAGEEVIRNGSGKPRFGERKWGRSPNSSCLFQPWLHKA